MIYAITFFKNDFSKMTFLKVFFKLKTQDDQTFTSHTFEATVAKRFL